MLGDTLIGCNTIQILQDENFANEYRFTTNREFSRDYVPNVATGDCLSQQLPCEATNEYIRSRIIYIYGNLESENRGHTGGLRS